MFEDTGRARWYGRQPVEGREGALMGTYYGGADRRGTGGDEDPAKRNLMAKKEELEQKNDGLEVPEGSDEPGEYKKELTAALLELAEMQEDSQ